MISGLKMIFITIFSYLGIKHFNPELFDDLKKHTLGYFISIFSGLFTYISAPLPFKIDAGNPITMEFIKLAFAVLTVICVIPVQFVVERY